MNEKDDNILLAQVEDRIRRCEEHYTITTTCFLDLRQRMLAEGSCRNHRGLRYGFYGGYGDAERCMAVFFPDYVELSQRAAPGAAAGTGIGRGDATAGTGGGGADAAAGTGGGRGDAAAGTGGGGADAAGMVRYFGENPEDDPLTVIRAEAAGRRKLTHRDYLGSLTGLGLKREMIGDILVREEGADILIAREITEFLLYHYEKAGRTSLELSVVPLPQLIVLEGIKEEKRDTVASLRLDNMIASVFSLSRGKAADAIRGGLVYVNSQQIQKPDAQVNVGDKLVLRGRGKAILKEVGGQTRKDRIFVLFDRHM